MLSPGPNWASTDGTQDKMGGWPPTGMQLLHVQ